MSHYRTIVLALVMEGNPGCDWTLANMLVWGLCGFQVDMVPK